MCIIIYYGNSIKRPLVFKTAGRSLEAAKGRKSVPAADSQQICYGNCGNSIVNIVLAGNLQGHMPGLPVGAVKQERGVSMVIICDVIGIIVILCPMTICYDPAGQVLRQLLITVDVTVYDQRTVLWQQLCKLPERMADICQIVEKVQMILLHIQDQTDFGEKA